MSTPRPGVLLAARVLLVLASLQVAGCASVIFKDRDDMWDATGDCLADRPNYTPCIAAAEFVASNARDDGDRKLAARLLRRSVEIYQAGCPTMSAGCVDNRERIQRLAYLLPEPPDLGSSSAEAVDALCTEDDVKHCVDAVNAYERGVGVERDEGKALSFAVRGCVHGELKACEQMTNLAKRTAAPTASATVAALAQACAADTKRGCRALSDFAEARPASAPEAFPHLKKGCDEGRLPACEAGLSLQRHVPGDDMLRWAVALQERRCLEGGPDRSSACWVAANPFRHNARVAALSTDRVREVRLLDTGCFLEGIARSNEMGDLCAQLAEHLEAGVGGKMDRDRAAVATERACKFDSKRCRRESSSATVAAARPAEAPRRAEPSPVSRSRIVSYTRAFSSDSFKAEDATLYELKVEFETDVVLGNHFVRDAKVLGFRPVTSTSGDYTPCPSACPTSPVMGSANRYSEKIVGFQTNLGVQVLYFRAP